MQPRNADARSASLRENRLSRHLGALPARRPALGLASPRRGGLRTPSREALPPPGDRPLRPPAFRAPVRDHDVPWFMSGRSLRTRTVHPSEKTGLRLVSGFSTQGDPLCAWHPPLEGRAPHASEASEVSFPSPWSSQTRSSNEMPLTFKAVSVLLPIESRGSPRIVRN